METQSRYCVKMTLDSLIASAQENKKLSEEKQYFTAYCRQLPSIAVLSHYEPKKEWFILPSGGLHGIMHEARVLVHAEMLGQMKHGDGEKIDMDALRYGSITHDVRRVSGWCDFSHGARAAKWLLDTKPIPEAYCAAAAEIIKWHVTQDEAIPHMFAELSLFKDADGLDRWRIGDLNENYLRSWHAVNMMETARYLWLVSTALKQEKNADEFNAVLEAGRILGMVNL